MFVFLLVTLLNSLYIVMKFYGGVGVVKEQAISNLDHHTDCLIGNPAFTQRSGNYEWNVMKFSVQLCNDTRNN